MDLSYLRSFRLDLETFPYYNNKSNGIAIFDLLTAFGGAYILDKLLSLPKYIPFCKNKRYIYYLLVIPFGIIVHHIIAHIRSIQNRDKNLLFPQEMTYLNKKLFSLKLNVYHILLIILLYYIINTCK